MYSNRLEYYDLPTEYKETTLKLLMQSPKRMYVYWGVSDEVVKNFINNSIDYNRCRPILRIKNCTKNYSYDLPVDPFANNYYIDVEDTNCSYIVELGRYTPQNKYVNIYTSNEITVPSICPHDYSEEVTMKNYICLGKSRRIKVYIRKHVNQDYTDCPFDMDVVSSMEVMKCNQKDI